MEDLWYVPYSELLRVRKLDCDKHARTRLFATLCRINTLYMITLAGSGHIGSSFSAMDIVSWLFLNELRLSGGVRDIYFSSKGHDAPGLYSVLIGLGLLEFNYLHRLRRLGGLPGHPDISTPFIEANTGSLGMGISKAKGMAIAKRLKGQRANIFVLTGDGELQEGQFWESLPSAVHQRLDEIIVIVDHNKVQSDTYVANVSSLGDLERKFAAFGWHVGRCDGHDLKALSSKISDFGLIHSRPKILIADTVKGRGVSFMEHTAMEKQDELYRFHSGAPDDFAYENAKEELIGDANSQLFELGSSTLKLRGRQRPKKQLSENPQRLINAYAKALVEEAEKEPRIVVLDADLMLDCGLIPFKERFPDRFIECGIAEQDMVSQAGGLALQGKLPIVHSFACFLSTRANEQIYNNASEKTKIIYVGSLAGVLPGGPGHSHQSVRDISAISATPSLTLIQPCNEAEVGKALDYCINESKVSCYLRLSSIPSHIPFDLPNGYRLAYGKGVAIREGDDAVLFAYGPVLLTEAWKAAHTLESEFGIRVKIINLPWLNYIDTEWLQTAMNGYRLAIALDDHYVRGGQGDMISAKLATLKLRQQCQVLRLGLRELPACGSNSEVLSAHKLDAASLVSAIRSAYSR